MKSGDPGARLVPPGADDASDSFQQRALLAAIAESSDDAIVSKTLESRILSWNAGATRIFGYRPDEMIGKPINIIIPPELFEEERQIVERIARGERIDHFDTIRLSRDGQRIAISLTVSPVRDANGTVIGASKVARDVSERKRAELALKHSQEALREADRRKDEFLALLAHELRNPLAPIRYALAANTLVAVTGWGQEKDRKRALQSGFDHHLVKPIAPEALEAVLRRVTAAPG